MVNGLPMIALSPNFHDQTTPTEPLLRRSWAAAFQSSAVAIPSQPSAPKQALPIVDGTLHLPPDLADHAIVLTSGVTARRNAFSPTGVALCHGITSPFAPGFSGP